jgi:hypothetical protein
MVKESILITLVIQASMLLTQTSADAACPNGPFETTIEKISLTSPPEPPSIKAQQEADFAVPIEISRITTGGISFFQGGLINEGISTWYAFDVERHLLIAVITSTNEHSQRIPAVEKLSSSQILRYTTAAGYRRVEFVTIISATPVQIREFSCLANKLLVTESDRASNRPLRADTMKRSFSLLHCGEALDVGQGQKRWEIQGILEQSISQPLQRSILQTFEP